MDFRPNTDQAALLAAIEKIALGFETVPVEFDGFCLTGDELDVALTEGQFFELASVPEFGPVAAAMVVERLAQLPYTVECAHSMLVLPSLVDALGAQLPRPLALIEHDRPGRFVAQARSVLFLNDDAAYLAQVRNNELQTSELARPLESLYAYPMAQWLRPENATALPDALVATVRSRLQLACAAELTGLMQAALDATVEHVSIRKQFGRELGTFQAIRHRLAECAVLVGGVRQLMLKAAASGEASDAALAALHAQDSATRLTYDVHQMLGAMGMTLETPLHLYTYRIKALLSELGGRSRQAVDAAKLCFA